MRQGNNLVVISLLDEVAVRFYMLCVLIEDRAGNNLYGTSVIIMSWSWLTL